MKRHLYFFVSASMLAVMMLTTTACDKGVGNGDGAKPDPAKPISLTTRQGAQVAADNAFAFDLFRETVAAADEPGNAFISPLSVTMALGMLYNGTSPDAGAEMAAALGVADFTDEEINEYYQKISRALLSADPLTALAIANSIWSEKTYPVKSSFVDINKTYYDAEVQSLDFSLKSTLDAINKWCADNTKGKIPTILDEIPSDMVMYLINAVYFKSKWASEFEKKNTRDEDFTLADGSTKSVKMMNQTTDLPYYWGEEDLQCVELPYGNGAFGMLVMLPPEGETLDEFTARLDADTYNNIVDGLYETEVNVKLPRFKKECEFSLVDASKALGMNLIFQEGGNLGGIADDYRLRVSMIKHKTFVEVNEEGTEAAAVTVIGEFTTSVPPPPPAFYADRPFLYIIRERSTGAILFMGRMDNPQS